RKRGPCYQRPSDVTTFTLDETALHGELVHRETHGLARGLLAHAGELEHDASGLDVGDPPLRGTLTRTHAGPGGLLGQRAVRVDVDPDLSATADVPGHRDTRRLDLTVGHVRRLEGLDAVLTEGDLGATLGSATPTGVVLLAVLD